MLYRKHYRMVAIIAGMALTAGMTACGAQNNAEYPESVDTHSTGVYGTSIENEMASAVAGRETQAETLPSQEPEDALARETQTLQENSIPEAEETVPQSEALEAHGADQTETVSSQPAEYTDL